MLNCEVKISWWKLLVFYSRLFDGNMLSEFWRCSHRLAAVLKKYYEKLLDKKRWETQEECLFDVEDCGPAHLALAKVAQLTRLMRS